MRIAIVSLLLVFSAAVRGDSLFDSEELLNVEIQGPLEQLVESRDKDLVFTNSTITYEEGEHSVAIPVRLQTRGKTRLDKMTCSFPPLRLLFEKDAVQGSVFDKQKKLKLVTQCRPELQQHADYVLSEYLAYKILNLLTPNSYRVRLAKLRYLDLEGGLLNESYGFFLESNKRLAKRINERRVRIFETHVGEMDRAHLNLVSLFQYLIGHMDWSATHTSRDECCHNGRLFGDREEKNLKYIPYDFDFSGFVNADYARVSPAYGLKNVRQRRYGGYCSNNKLLPGTIQLFNVNRDAMMTLINETLYLAEQARSDRIDYINSFFDIVNDGGEVKSKLHSFCYRSDDV